MEPSHTFLDQLLAAADAAGRRPRRERRRHLARWLVQAYVPDVRVGGVDLRTWIAPGRIRQPHAAAPEPGPAWELPTELTAGGQDEEAYRHLAAAAAAVLARRSALVTAASLLDWIQGLVRGNPREARAEIAGNRTGAQIGHALAAFLENRLSRPALEQHLRARLT